jgi:hypothetical protein
MSFSAACKAQILLDLNGPTKELAEKVGRAMNGVPSAAKAEPVYNHLRSG